MSSASSAGEVASCDTRDGAEPAGNGQDPTGRDTMREAHTGIKL